MKNIFILLLSILTITACVKTEFDEPVPNPPVVLNPTATIAQLKAKHVTGNRETITDDWLIGGTVVMDDRSGNYYKTFVIQDATAGIEVKVDNTNLFNDYPVGRTVYIYVKGLILTDYNETVQLIGSVITEAGQERELGLNGVQIEKNVVKGAYGTATPTVKKIEDITSADISTLVTFENVQFIDADADQTYADGVNLNSLNRTVEACGTNSLMLVRSSGYASFANDKTPTGQGSLTGVVGWYGGSPQLYIRDVSDVAFTNARCCPGFDPAAQASVNELFDGVTQYQDIAISKWSNNTVKGSKKWYGGAFGTDKFAENEAYNSNLAEMESWLVSPGVDLSTPKTLSFKTAMAFYKHDGLTVWISTDYTGCNAATATWTQLSATIATNADGNYTWVPSGNVNLPVMAGKTGFIGFKYVGSTTLTTKFRVDEVVIQ